jgi:hypothetical protein
MTGADMVNQQDRCIDLVGLHSQAELLVVTMAGGACLKRRKVEYVIIMINMTLNDSE